MSSTKKKIIISIVSVIALVALACGIYYMSFGISVAVNKDKYQFINFVEYQQSSSPVTRIHFMNTGHSDAFLLESNGHFGLIDAGEDNDNPRNFPGLELKGYEQKVIDYIKKTAIVDGEVKLDFIIGTHSHSDHIGGVDSVINDADISVDTLYIKRYYEGRISNYEVKEWDNKEVYEQAINAAKANDVAIVQDLVDLKVQLGDLTVNFYNGEEAAVDKKVGENENSLALLVEGKGLRLMFSGDMNNIDGDEDRVGKAVGKVDLLKLGHHGLYSSTTTGYVRSLKPNICIVTSSGANHTAVTDITFIAKAPIYSTVKNDGIVIDITNGMQLYNFIH